MNNEIKIGFGGGCHWCTEAVFQHLNGVVLVEQGWIASSNENESFSEAVIVYFDENVIDLKTLIEIHLHTHKSTSSHSFRKKYRSAIYTFSKKQEEICKEYVNSFQVDFDHQIITQVLPFIEFKASREEIRNYYKKNPTKPFCETFINPKLRILLTRFSEDVNVKELNHLKNKTAL
ncbi:peptide-methionine (S)-S-oxide reductase [Tenacibaculum sp. MAR_2009_124]|uniref:peptide-methionine (S)-S-oxide reductase n=1 Tax=Tenacibaculum sp. MAR_2009_124 TaxID=1250059 RepID=UPI000898B5D9|nr:peptide-methionine (S)-S-oxide reductase [Tenacibaculum sp. MAR_2009_124]SED16207.1 peptide-methionine (S)-S-oxide reductase [Tenacibaculum sp. MAR_2009_124]